MFVITGEAEEWGKPHGHGFQVAAARVEIKQHLCAISAGILLWADRQTAVLPAQTGISV